MDESLKWNLFLFIAKNKKSTLKEIHKHLTETKIYSRSYKNTYKILEGLTNEKFLEKRERNYCINKGHFREFLSRLNEIESYLLGKKKEIAYEDNEEIIYESNSLQQLNELWIKIVEEEISLQKVNEVFWEGPNCWWLFASLLDEVKYLNYLKRYNIEAYFKIKIPNELNKNAEEFYISRGFLSKIIDCPVEDKYLHVGIVGNKIIQVTYPKEINSLLDKIYLTKDKSSFLKSLQEIVSLEIPLKLKVLKNSELAKTLSESIQRVLVK
jgi:hypothetical protein